MKVAILGTGAMGSVYAVLMADAGNEVWVLDAWAAHLDAMEANGLRVEGASDDRTVRVNVARSAAEAGPCDLVVLATKADGVAAALTASQALFGPETPVLVMQNGLGAVDRAAEVMPRERIMVGVAEGFGASMKGPGHAHHNGMKLIRLGEAVGGGSHRLGEILSLWQGAGFKAAAYEDIERLVWEKFICNSSFSAPCTAFGRTVGEMMADPGTRAVVLGCGREAWEVARAHGVAISFDDPEAYIADFASHIPGARPSMLLDHMAGRRSELDFINGMVVSRGREKGVPTPCNETMSRIVRAREESFA